MTTLRAVVNKHGFNILDVTFDVAGTQNLREIVLMCVKSALGDYDLTEEYFDHQLVEAVLKKSSYHWYEESIITFYYEEK